MYTKANIANLLFCASLAHEWIPVIRIVQKWAGLQLTIFYALDKE